MKTEIHKLEEKFLDGIVQIENDSFKYPWSYDAYFKEIQNEMATYLVVTDGEGTVIAYGGFWKVLDEADITNIAVKRDCRNQGIGRLLTKALIEEARAQGIRAMTLEVRVSNKSAIRLYENTGFKSAGIRKNYYPDGEDAIIMWLEDI
jgi:ribosomal-protein-alanine N-acetyltransferase